VSFIPVLEYSLGLGIFGLVAWLLNGILEEFEAIGVHVTGTTYNILHMLYTACLLVYIVFGGWWLIRKYNEQEYSGGML